MLVGMPISMTLLDMRFGNLILYAQFVRQVQPWTKWQSSTTIQLDVKLVFRHINTIEYHKRLNK